MAKTSEAKMRANKKYEKAHIRQILLKFHKTHDAAIIEKLDSLDSKNNYVRQLILKDLEMVLLLMIIRLVRLVLNLKVFLKIIILVWLR